MTQSHNAALSDNRLIDIHPASPEAQTTATANTDAAASSHTDGKAERPGKQYFSASANEWLWGVIYMLSLTLTGLAMPLGNLLVVLCLIREYQRDRSGFLFMLLLAVGDYAISAPKYQWGVNASYLIAIVSVIGFCIIRKTPVIKKTIVAFTAYVVVVSFIAFGFGAELMTYQWKPMTGFFAFCFFVIPLLVFYDKETFDIHAFWKKGFILMLIMSVFYIIDGYILCGWVMVPCSFIDYDADPSTWLHPYTRGFLAEATRKYPPGIYAYALLIYPLARYYKLRWYHWLMVIGALMASRTSSTMFAWIIGFVLAQGSLKKYGRYLIIAIVGVSALYFVDDAMGYDENDYSTLRVAYMINQLTDLTNVEDDEDLSEAGTGRMAQAIPAVEMTFANDREWTGYGFVNPLTDNPDLQMYCDLIENPLLRVRAVNDVEITPVRVFVSLGWIGLAVWFIFVFGVYRIIRHLKMAGYYLNVAIILMIYGVGGFDSWFTAPGVLIGGLAYGIVLLLNKSPQNLERLKLNCLEV